MSGNLTPYAVTNETKASDDRLGEGSGVAVEASHTESRG